jgi:hypothetical protein
VQIVTFDKETGQRPEWYKQHRNPDSVKQALARPLAANHWRWIHCAGMHGPTLHAVAEGTGTRLIIIASSILRFPTGWDVGKFAEIFIGAFTIHETVPLMLKDKRRQSPHREIQGRNASTPCRRTRPHHICMASEQWTV